MGFGAISVWAKRTNRPERLLQGFTWTATRVEILLVRPDPSRRLTLHLMNVGCGMVMYCSKCGVRMCPGCGNPSLLVTREGPLTACVSDECQRAFRLRLQEEGERS